MSEQSSNGNEDVWRACKATAATGGISSRCSKNPSRELNSSPFSKRVHLTCNLDSKAAIFSCHALKEALNRNTLSSKQDRYILSAMHAHAHLLKCIGHPRDRRVQSVVFEIRTPQRRSIVQFLVFFPSSPPSLCNLLHSYVD